MCNRVVVAVTKFINYNSNKCSEILQVESGEGSMYGDLTPMFVGVKK